MGPLEADGAAVAGVRAAQEDAPAVQPEVAILEAELADGPKPSKALEAAAASRGLSWKGAIRRASKRLRVIKYTPAVGVPGAVWMWRLPDR